ncbi:MAG TPA: 5-formyltetrahydrofolate cyclo-ligase [Stellaceae bacterium]|nr:5-formyltetrahydrofolate cyclo-ligase [Stellaceae bacterium]
MSPNTLADVAALKATLRTQARERRAVAYRATGTQVAAQLSNFLPELYLPPRCVVAGYLQRGSELDPLPALKSLRNEGYHLALPVVTAKNAPLVFRAWAPDDPVTPDAQGLPAPLPSSPEIVPEVVLVPLVAFDSQGHRLGTGAGYYDRTLPGLRAQNPKLLAVGLAFSIQQERELPLEATDVPLDVVITERGAQWFRGRKG